MPDHFGGDGAAFLRSSHAGVRSVNLVGAVAADLAAVASAIANLTLDDLALLNTDLGPAHMWTLAPALGGLKHLHISESRIEDEGLTALAKAQFPTLTTLCLYRCGLGADGAQALANSTAFSNLSELSLAGDHPGWPRSSHTDIYPHNKIGPKGAAALSTWDRPLDHLNLNGNAIGDEGARALATGRCKPLYLELKTNGIGPAGAKAFAENDPGRMHALELTRNTIGKEGVAAFARSPFLGKFRYLGLTSNEVDSDRVVDYTDWNGAVVSSGLEEMTANEIREKFGFPAGLTIV